MYQSTPSFVHLDHEDIDGLVDIARYGLEPLIKNPATINLLERLAHTIAVHATGQPIKWQDYQADEPDDPPNDYIGGIAIVQVWPVEEMYSNRED